MSDRSGGHDGSAINALIAAKRRFLVPMTLIFMTGYIGLTVLAGFAKPLLATKVIGSVNLGFALIAANYILAWVLAIAYTRIANATFDPLADAAAQSVLRSEAAQ